MISPLPLNRPARPWLALLGCVLAPLAARATDLHQNHEHMHEGAVARQSAPVQAGDLSISAAWARATVPGVDVAAAYLSIANHGRRSDVLVGVETPAAGKAEVHESTQKQGVSRMNPAGEIAIPAGKSVKIEPGGLHIMLSALPRPLAAGTQIPLTLQFRHAGKVTVQVPVIPLSATAPSNP